MATSVAFSIFAVVAIVAAVKVVTSTNIVRAALALVTVLAAMAPLFLLLGAEFTALVQILVYVGAVIVLFLFGIMLTRAPFGPAEHDHVRRWPGVVVAAALCVALCLSIGDAVGDDQLAPDAPQTTAQVGASLLSEHVLAFEAISVLLLAALVGSLVLARRD